MLSQRGVRRSTPTGRPRASPLLVITGLALVAITFAWPTWFALQSAADRDPVGEFGTFGTAGLVAVLLGWASFAPSYPRAVLRTNTPLIVLVIVPALIGLFLGQFEIYRNIQGRDDSFEPVDEYDLTVWSLMDPAAWILLGVVVTATPSVFGVLARASVVARRRRRDVAGALLLLSVAIIGVLHLVNGNAVAALVAIVSLVWLVWALRSARAPAIG